MEPVLHRYCDEVLYYHWDPIGVSEVPAARDEYDDYVLAVVRLVMGGATEVEIASHLTEIERSRMALPPNEDRARHTAGILAKWREALADPKRGARLVARCA